MRNRFAELAECPQVPLNRLPDIPLCLLNRLSRCDTARQIGHVCGPVIFRLFENDSIPFAHFFISNPAALKIDLVCPKARHRRGLDPELSQHWASMDVCNADDSRWFGRAAIHPIQSAARDREPSQVFIVGQQRSALLVLIQRYAPQKCPPVLLPEKVIRVRRMAPQLAWRGLDNHQAAVHPKCTSGFCETEAPPYNSGRKKLFGPSLKLTWEDRTLLRYAHPPSPSSGTVRRNPTE